jgi:hypothetical protein
MVMFEVADNLNNYQSYGRKRSSDDAHGIVVVRLHVIHDTLLRGSIFGRLISHVDD